MLWSPSEVLAYIKDDKSSDEIDKRETEGLQPTAPFGGFKIWPTPKEDFIFIAENSEIHGPNPLFTIPKLTYKIDLNLLSTQILSADYQGLSNNKILPGKNAQLLMPDIAADVHAAIIYFFLFDSDARGFVRPMCIAYFTSDKYKLVKLADPILKRLTEAASILQHSNILHCTDDLKALKENIISSSETKSSMSREIVSENVLKDVQEVLDIVEGYEGNDLFDTQISCLIDLLKQNSLFKQIQNFLTTPLVRTSPESYCRKLSSRPNSKKSMKDLYHICGKGVIFSLYHLFITYKYFRRKYRYITLSESFSSKKENFLQFGACVKTVNRKSDTSSQNKCSLRLNRTPAIFSISDENYFECLNAEFEKVLLRFINWENEFDCLTESSFSDHTGSEESVSNVSTSSGYLSNECDSENLLVQEKCCHIVPLHQIWDTLEQLQKQYPDIEKTFLRVLKLFDDAQKLMFSILTRLPIIIISAYHQLDEAINFILALSIFIPRNEKEIIFVDKNRQEPLTANNFSKFAAINICLDDHCTVEGIIPLDFMEKMCILNLRDCSLTAPSYMGCLLADLDQRLRILPTDGPVFAVLISFLSEIEYALNRWHMITASSVESSEASAYVLSKGYTRSDMQIIETLYKLWKISN